MKIAGIISGIFRRPLWRTGAGLRARVHKISIIAGGEVSVVLRFGLDEPRAKQLLQGTLVEVFETREGVPGENVVAYRGVKSIPVQASPAQAADPCTCHAPGGYPHEPDCPWWDAQKGAAP